MRLLRSLDLRRSSHFRLILWYTLMLAVLALAFEVFIYGSQMRDYQGDARFRLGVKFDDASRALVQGEAPYLQDGDLLAAFDEAGLVLEARGLDVQAAADLRLRALAAPVRGKFGGKAEDPSHHGEAQAWLEATVGGTAMLVVYSGIKPPRTEGGLVDREALKGMAAKSLLYASPLDPYGLKQRLVLTLLGGLGLLVLASLGGGWWLAGRAMKPVAQIAHTARSIGEGDLSRRIHLASRDELGELADTFDAMLDRLESAFERQKRFVADAGHELKTPLSVISLEAQGALEAERSPGEYRRSLEAVRQECAYMAKLVEDLLSLAQADRGGTQRREALDFGELTLGVLERLAPLASSKGLSLQADDLPEVLVQGEARALESLVGNLVENAIKYTSGPGARIHVSLELGDQELALRVADQGQGIAQDKLGLIFDRFYRVDEARAEVGGLPGGSGLGLAIVKAVAEAHGGRVEVESRVGEGSTFTVRLPTLGCPT